MEITFETEETVVLHEGSKVSVEYCSECASEVLMATPRAAAFLSTVSEREIFRRVELGLLHFSENGRVMICLNSLKLIGNEIQPWNDEAGRKGEQTK
jgi:hypothetical protein